MPAWFKKHCFSAPGVGLLAGLILLAAMQPGAMAQDTGGQDADSQVTTGFNPVHATKAQLSEQSWTMLSTAVENKHPDTRIQALAALGTMEGAKSSALILKGMDDPDLDVRTAAILAATYSRDLTLRGKMQAMLDDKEPQVAFAAATTLWKMKDHTGEDILVAVASGGRSANATLMNGTKHTVNKDLHNPTMLAKMGALEGASMLLGPFGFGITAYEYIKKNGGNSARVQALEEIAEERTAPIKAELVGALVDKDPTVRAAAAKALGTYHDPAAAAELGKVLIDTKAPVRFTAAAAYLRSVGAAGSRPVAKMVAGPQ